MANDLPELFSGLVAIVTLPLGILTALSLGWKAALVVFVLGWFLIVPSIAFVGEEVLPVVRDAQGEQKSEDETAGPLDELKQRYARGEIGDAEFERQVENLVKTEDVTVGRDADFERSKQLDADRIHE